jgi:UDP-N-acetylmuramate--alanine ligase
VTPRFDLAQPVPPAEELGAVHFVGVGGVGMSGIARVMLARGLAVSGSDAKDLPVLAALRAVGGRVEVGFDAARLDGVGTVVAGSAIRDDNVELRAARARGLRVLHRSQALQAVMVGRRVAAVAGTNGKTTTSSMLTVVLQHAGWEPSFAIGGELAGAGTNAHDGTGDVFVAEADESDSSFLVYAPDVAVVTNVQPDHLDHHGTVEALERAFVDFAARLRPGGVLVACTDDRGSAALAARRRAALAAPGSGGGPRGAVVTFGESLDADVRVSDPRPAGGRIGFTLAHGAWGGHPAAVHRIDLRVPGWHNVLDAAAAFAAALALGLAPDAAADGLRAFTGTRRRFEPRGEAAGVRVYDDYAHNPAKVAAAVATGRQVAGSGRLCVVFQPHLYSRTLDFAEEFGAALSSADEVVVMDVYAAREDPVPGVTGALVADAVALAPERVVHVPSWSAVTAEVCRRVGPGDLVLTVGAGDVTMVAAEVLALLATRAAPRGRRRAGGSGGPAGGAGTLADGAAASGADGGSVVVARGRGRHRDPEPAADGGEELAADAGRRLA